MAQNDHQPWSPGQWAPHEHRRRHGQTGTVMADSPAAVQQEAMLRDDAEARAPGEPAASPGRSWVRPVACAVLGISLALLGAVVFRYVRDHPSLDVPPGASQVGIGMLAGTLALMALAVVVFRPEHGTVRSLAWTSAGWSLALLLGLILAWAANASFERQDAWHGTPLQNTADLDAYLAQHVPQGSDPILIPTGILVQSVEFLTGDNVQITG